MKVTIEIFGGMPSREPCKEDVVKTINALQKVANGENLNLSDEMYIMDAIGIFEELRKQVPNR
jgi:hypothetical protein